jgi:hypothetical protein
MAVSTIDALYNGTSEKLTTSATGITVTGTVAATAYTGDGSALTGVGSPSIDDNGNATAMTIDSSENVLIGKTATGGNVAGMQIINGSFFSHVRDGGVVQVLNRKSSDGDILSFEKDNTAVGKIGVVSDDRMYFATADGLGLQFDKDNNRIIPCDATGGYNSNVELGDEGLAFTNLFLTGGIQFDSRSSKLDDYEEGTYTVTATPETTGTQTLSSTHRILNYTKIGRVVKVNGNVYISSNSSAAGSTLFNLPFASSSAIKDQSFSVLGVGSYPVGTSTSLMSAGSNMRAYKSDNGPLSAPQWYSIDFTYITDA